MSEERPVRGSSDAAGHGKNTHPVRGRFRRWLVGAFYWHLLGFAVLNALLALTNAFMGPPWWAFWPLFASGLLLAVHYFSYKTAVVDEQWAAERVEELNLKSYDRSHIEDLKARYPMNEEAERDRR
jgi:2TM domain